MDRIEACLARVEESTDAQAREASRTAMRLVLELHAAGLEKILSIAADDTDAGRRVLTVCLADDLVRSLLLLHELHPESLQTRLEQALAEVRPYLESHGGNVELLDLDDGVVRLRMRGNCHGCP